MKIPHVIDQWRKSSYSGGQTNCIEVALSDSARVRDTKDRNGGHLALPVSAWRSFTAGVKHNH